MISIFKSAPSAAIIVGVTGLLAVSCARDKFESEKKIFSDNYIGFEVFATDADEMSVTKSSVTYDPLMLASEQGDSLMLFVSAKPNADMCIGGMLVDTKGTPITTDNFKTEYKKFKVTAFRTGTVAETGYINNDTAIYSSETGRWDTDPLYAWPNYGLDFYAYAPDDITGLTNLAYSENATLGFTYQLPVGGQTDEGGKFIDAQNQKDIIFAITKNAQNNTTTGKVGFTFEHALSAVQFIGGNIEGAGTIKSITFKNLSSKGDVTFDGSDFTWSNQDAQEKSYSQNFDIVLDKKEDPQQITAKEVSKTFMMIPQTIDGTTTILELYYLRPGDSEPVKFTAAVPAITWQAGYTYIYRIGLADWLDIELDDTIENNVKKDIQISNVGGRDAYVRALIVGYWVNTDGDIVANWNPTDAKFGTFSPAIFSGTLNENWVKGADGFFYYKHVLPVGETVPDDARLFDTYTALPSGKPKNLKDSDHLEIDVVTQAVLANTGKAAAIKAWGSIAAGYIDEYTVD